ncbi:type II toxin-antitoxin system Phd/YefM family antitoxin [uncultured Cocleimonas sp.]|uniref:type II toxin-antitoxin system Phd/YefM family antitoxin n=1 Tax=uncultured Cocleimonas sp. TaxID=1051587 RepID=UPI0026317732|nr:type II toxin-antitoxin system Phd/YefM family antitoxin [uncultured Cocleimonas sp.]
MQRLRLDQDIRPLSEFRAGVATFFKQIQETKRPLVITQHGKGVGVLLGVEEYEEMQETIELLQDVQKSVSQINDGEGIEHKNAKNLVLTKLSS